MEIEAPITPDIPDSSEPHPWVITESAGDADLLELLVKREELIDTVTDKGASSTAIDEAKEALTDLAPSIISSKKALGIETTPPLPQKDETPDSA